MSSGLCSASFSCGALSGTPTNVTFSVAHNDDNMNAKAPIVMANSTICTTMRAETTQPSLATEVEVIFSTSKKTAGAMVAKPPRAVRRIKEMKCGPSTPPLDPLAEGHGRQQERQNPGRGLYQGHRKPTSRIVECPQVLEGPEVPTQDAEGEHTNEGSQSHRDPEPRAQSVGGMDVLHDRLIRQVRTTTTTTTTTTVGHAFLL